MRQHTAGRERHQHPEGVSGGRTLRIIWKRRPVSRPPLPYLTCRTVPPRKKMAHAGKTAPEGAIMTLNTNLRKKYSPAAGAEIRDNAAVFVPTFPRERIPLKCAFSRPNPQKMQRTGAYEERVNRNTTNRPAAFIPGQEEKEDPNVKPEPALCSLLLCAALLLLMPSAALTADAGVTASVTSATALRRTRGGVEARMG